MFWIKILIGGLLSTAFMTAFSYLWGLVTFTLTKEPVLLNILLRRSDLSSGTVSKTDVRGWFLHFLIGMVFILIIFLLWDFDVIRYSIRNAIIFGFLAGIVGAAGWKFMFAMTDPPPRINYINYYVQLIFAHIIFGITAYFVYRYFPA